MAVVENGVSSRYRRFAVVAVVAVADVAAAKEQWRTSNRSLRPIVSAVTMSYDRTNRPPDAPVARAAAGTADRRQKDSQSPRLLMPQAIIEALRARMVACVAKPSSSWSPVWIDFQ